MCNLGKNIEANTIARIICRIMEHDKRAFEEAVQLIHISDDMAAFCRPFVEKYFEIQIERKQN